MIIDILLLLVFGLVTWCVASEGPWGAALTCLSVIFGGLLAMNFFEPVAALLEQYVSASPDMSQRWDVIALVGIFAITVTLLRLATDRLLPTFIAVHAWLFEGMRWGGAALTGYVTIAILLTALHTARLPREFLGFTPERSNLFNVVAPDRQWLGFTQYVSEYVFVRSYYVRGADGLPEQRKRIFDGPYTLQGLPKSATEGEVAATRPEVWPTFPIRYATRRDGLSSTRRVVTGSGGGGSGQGLQRRRSSGKTQSAPSF